MTKPRVLRIGIASRDAMIERTLRIARGDYKPKPDEPRVWFASLESLAQVLSSRNQLLLKLIARAEPASLRELARLSGRRESNLSRTLKTLERYKLVELKRLGREIVPRVPYEKLDVEAPIEIRARQPSRMSA
jgi:predicted transcriptional regulator